MTDDNDTNQLDMLTVSEACDLLGVSKYNVYRMIHSGALPAVRLRTARNKYRIARSTLEDFLAGDYVPVELSGDDTFRSVGDVARRLNCSHETVRRLISAGLLDAIRFPGRSSRLRISDAAIEKYIATHAAIPIVDDERSA